MAEAFQSGEPYWSRTASELIRTLESKPTGLSSQAAAERLEHEGFNTVADDRPVSWGRILTRQFRSPLVIVLLGAAVIAGSIGDRVETLLIAVILLASSALGFAQEFRASRAIEALRRRLGITCRVWRDGVVARVPTQTVVPGDVIELSAGSLIPADGVVITSLDCFVVQSVLTGESAPVEKLAGPSAATAAMTERTNVLFMGTSVRSGVASMLAVRTGARTCFGQLAQRLKVRRPESDFEQGIRRFSALLTEFVLVLTVVVMALNLLLARPPLESLLFTIALAVGITPELLPAIVTFTLSRGARALAARGVLVRRLAAIEDLGSMTVLCADKTGTLTVGAASVAAALDAQGTACPRVLELAVLNARLQTGLGNPLDEVIVAADPRRDARSRIKVDERPYDFLRKRMSIAVKDEATGEFETITKGAVPSVIEICTSVRQPSGIARLSQDSRAALLAQQQRHASQGFRVLAVASRTTAVPVAEESDMVFEGLLLFEDAAKPDIVKTLRELRSLGVRLKIVTGDNQYTARHVAEAVGLSSPKVLTGQQMQRLPDEALWHQAETTDVFAEVDPNQKERIILALRKIGHVVGYIGDGINDAPALQAADVGISVDSAVDVAKEAADIVLLAHDLRVVNRGIRQGRRTFANTQKYLLYTTSANFGNMLSMAAASAFLPFLPLTAAQILLNNLLSDIPAVSLAGDRVEHELVRRPTRWSMRRIRNFTLVFGAVSSFFDLLTFVALLHWGQGLAAPFRTGWFFESLATEVLVLLVIRSPQPVYRSRPGSLMLWSSLIVLLAAVLLIQTSAGGWLGFTPLPADLFSVLVLITLIYAATVEWLKRRLYGLGGRRESREV
jgi:Mg2+-importing ATPase